MCALRALPSALARKAAEELNENPANNAEYLNSFRDWLQMQTHFKARMCDQFLIAFLRASKFSLERAKQKLENYYIYRAMMPELFTNYNIDDPKVCEIVKSGSLLHLPEPICVDGPRVVMIRVGCFDLEKFSIPDIFKVGAMSTDILINEDDNAIVAGYVLIMDLANVSKRAMLHFEPNFVKKLTIVSNKMCPARMKGFHFLNVPPFFEKVYNLIKSVINVKLRERFYVHGKNLDGLYAQVPKRILPKEYGGECVVSDMQDQWWQRLHGLKDFIEEEQTYGLIKGRSKAYLHKHIPEAAVFGIEGSFRKLNLD